MAKKHTHTRARSPACGANITFQECELAILRMAVDRADKLMKQKKHLPSVDKIIALLEQFLRRKKLVCYGGTAINNILPQSVQFYDRALDIPDYDFYSHQALHDAKELADLYIKHGFTEVEAKSGIHFGTYKVFVNFIPIADITYLPKPLFLTIKQHAMSVAGILYAPPNLLRMSMYLELSRPEGDVSRWEKVLKRLTLLNKHFPLRGKQCARVSFQRNMTQETQAQTEYIYESVKESLIHQGVVFFGGFALSLYSQYMPVQLRKQIEKIPDFDVLAENPQQVVQIVQERLQERGIKHVSVKKHPGVGELIAPHYELKVGQNTVAFVYQPIACHSYNTIRVQGRDIHVASIDTMLSFWLAFLFADRPYYDSDRILCMSHYLFEVQEKNRLAQKGLLRRFSLQCIGHQPTMEEIREIKANKFSELDKNHPEYDKWFLRYRPEAPNPKPANHPEKTKQSRKKKRFLF